MVTLYVAQFKYGKARVCRVQAEEKPSTYWVDPDTKKELIGGWMSFSSRIKKEALDQDSGSMFVSLSLASALSWLRGAVIEAQEEKLDEVSDLTNILIPIVSLLAIVEMQKGEVDE